MASIGRDQTQGYGRVRPLRARIPHGPLSDILPDGVARGGLTPVAWDPGQLTIKFDGNDPIAGYDPDEFVKLKLVGRGQDPKDDRCYRSHLGRIVTKRLDKIIGLPCVKDHHAAGATGALKNMSHGLVNNVFRSHSCPQSVAMVAFIPAVVSHPIIRKKCVLHIMDGTRGVWDGGPFGRNPEWYWDYNALLFATDPVAMDHVEWDILDAQRTLMKVPGVGAVGRLAADPLKHEMFDIRQPQYIAVAGQARSGKLRLKSPRAGVSRSITACRRSPDSNQKPNETALEQLRKIVKLAEDIFVLHAAAGPLDRRPCIKLHLGSVDEPALPAPKHQDNWLSSVEKVVRLFGWFTVTEADFPNAAMPQQVGWVERCFAS